MTIGSITSVAPVTAADRQAAVQQAVADKLKAAPPPKEPFDPAPALRPTIQDKIEINRALLALRKL